MWHFVRPLWSRPHTFVGHFEAGLIHLSAILLQVTHTCQPFWSRPHTFVGHFVAGHTHLSTSHTLVSDFETGHNLYVPHCPTILKQFTNTLDMWLLFGHFESGITLFGHYEAGLTHLSAIVFFAIDTVLWQLRRFALRFFHSHSGVTGVFCLICRTVYFRCAANLIAASSKIGVRRLKVRDLLIKICVHCALLCLAFLVLGRSWSASHYARNGVILRGYNVSNTVAGRLQFDNSQECIAKKTASGVATGVGL